MITPGFTPELGDRDRFPGGNGHLIRNEVLFTKDKGEVATHGICWQPDERSRCFGFLPPTPGAVNPSLAFSDPCFVYFSL